MGPLDYLFVCRGGAGLLSGCAIAASHLSPGHARDRRGARGGRRRGALVPHAHARSASTTRRPSPTARARSRWARSRSRSCCAHVHDIITVTDAQLVEAMRFLWERMKLVVEPTGALAAAGVLARRDRRARPARRHHPLRRQRRPEGRRAALRVSALPALGAARARAAAARRCARSAARVLAAAALARRGRGARTCPSS